MSRSSILLLPSTEDKLTVTGDPVRADLFGGRSARLYTVAIHAAAFYGTVHIEGTVVRAPTDGDWFDVIEPVLFEADFLAPLYRGGPKVLTFSFPGNFTWLRARVDRPPVPGHTFDAVDYVGLIDKVLLNF